jgi:hypothetical protein
MVTRKMRWLLALGRGFENTFIAEFAENVRGGLADVLGLGQFRGSQKVVVSRRI